MKVLKLEDVNVKKLAQRRQRPSKARAKVKDILDAVRTKGDEAVLELTKRFDKADLKDLRVTKEEVDQDGLVEPLR